MRFPVRIKVPLFSVVVLVAGALMASNLDTVSAKRERTLDYLRSLRLKKERKMLVGQQCEHYPKKLRGQTPRTPDFSGLS